MELSSIQTSVGVIFTPGRQISSRFTVLRSLGSGSSGTVLLVSDHELADQKFALKLPHPQLMSSAGAIVDFRNQILRNRQLAHPGIVRIFHSAELASGTPFFSMEYVSGCNLDQLRSHCSQLRLSPEEVTYVLLQILEPLAFAHTKGVIHQDLKPNNILVGRDGSIKISDFGFASSLNESQDFSRTGETVGTATYMAPEQFTRDKIGEHTDLYSLGIIAYELLTGITPYDERSFVALAKAHLHEPMPIDLLEDLKIPAHLIAFIKETTAKSPNERLGTAFEAQAILEKNDNWDADRAIKTISIAASRVTTSSSSSDRISKTAGRVLTLFLISTVVILLQPKASPEPFHGDLINISRTLGTDLRRVEKILGLPVIDNKEYLGIFQVIQDRNWPAFQAMYHSNPDTTLVDSGGNNIIHALVIDAEFLGWTLDKIPSPEINQAGLNHRNHSGETPLFLATRDNIHPAIKLLLSFGADPNATNNKGVSPVIYAAERGNTETIRLFFSYAKKNLETDNFDDSGRSLLQIAIEVENLEILEILLSNKLNVDQRNAKGQTALMSALQRRYTHSVATCVRRLLKAGASLNAHDNLGHEVYWYLERADLKLKELVKSEIDELR